MTFNTTGQRKMAACFCCFRCFPVGGFRTGHVPLKEVPTVNLDTKHMGKYFYVMVADLISNLWLPSCRNLRNIVTEITILFMFSSEFDNLVIHNVCLSFIFMTHGHVIDWHSHWCNVLHTNPEHVHCMYLSNILLLVCCWFFICFQTKYHSWHVSLYGQIKYYSKIHNNHYDSFFYNSNDCLCSHWYCVHRIAIWLVLFFFLWYSSTSHERNQRRRVESAMLLVA